MEKKLRRQKEKLEAHKTNLKELISKYDPHKDGNASGDPFRTLFVARISYDTTEKKLKREFEVFGSIKKVRMVYDTKGKPRGYAFIEYEHERDLKNAYKQGDGKKIDGRRVMVDVERGRTVEGWTPRRLGGGRGPGRVGKPSKKKMRLMQLEKDNKQKERDEKDDKKKDERKGRDDRGGDRDRDRRGGDRDKDRGGDKKPEDRGGGGDRDRRGGGDKKPDRGGDRDRRGGGDDRGGGDKKRESGGGGGGGDGGDRKRRREE